MVAPPHAFVPYAPKTRRCAVCLESAEAHRKRPKPRYSGELWIDEDGATNFKFHIDGGDFNSAKDALEKFITCLQEKLNNAARCPRFQTKNLSVQ